MKIPKKIRNIGYKLMYPIFGNLPSRIQRKIQENIAEKHGSYSYDPTVISTHPIFGDIHYGKEDYYEPVDATMTSALINCFLYPSVTGLIASYSGYSEQMVKNLVLGSMAFAGLEMLLRYGIAECGSLLGKVISFPFEIPFYIKAIRTNIQAKKDQRAREEYGRALSIIEEYKDKRYKDRTSTK